MQTKWDEVEVETGRVELRRARSVSEMRSCEYLYLSLKKEQCTKR